MIVALLLIVIGIASSAFFSGTETGFYRVSRVRLVLDGVDGSYIARGLLWLTNHPGIFVSTVLVGNAIANYMISLGIVVLTTVTFGVSNTAIDLMMSLITTPIVFIIGELLPKSLFYQNPYRLLKRAGIPVLLITILLAPISLLMYLVSLIFQNLIGETPLKVRPALARRELKQVLQEGQEAGLLLTIQRDVAQNIFAYGANPISQYCMPLRGLRALPSSARLEEIRSAALKSTQPIVAVLHPRDGHLVGYYRSSDILSARDKPPKLRAVTTLRSDTTQAVALSDLISRDCELARVVGPRNEMLGVVLSKRLVSQMLQQI